MVEGDLSNKLTIENAAQSHLSKWLGTLRKFWWPLFIQMERGQTLYIGLHWWLHVHGVPHAEFHMGHAQDVTVFTCWISDCCIGWSTGYCIIHLHPAELIVIVGVVVVCVCVCVHALTHTKHTLFYCNVDIAYFLLGWVFCPSFQSF